MKIVNALISVFLLSCVFTCNSASVLAYRNLQLDGDERKQPTPIELSGQLEALKLIFSERKKNRTTTYSAVETNFLEATVYPNEYATSKAKNNKNIGTKKQTTTRYGGTTKINNKNGSKDIDTSNNRWKKIQNFFFRSSTSWPFTRSYKSQEQTTIETRWYVEYLKPDQSKEEGREVDGTTIIVRTYIHPIQDNKRFYGKEERILVKEEIIKDKIPDWNNIDINKKAHPVGPSDKPSSDEIDHEVGKSAKEQSDKILQIELPHLKESMISTVDPQEDILFREWIIKKEKLSSGHQVIGYEKLPYMHMILENHKLPPKTVIIENGKFPNSKEVIKNEKVPPGNELLQNEKLPSRYELMQNEKFPSTYKIIENDKLLTTYEAEIITTEENIIRDQSMTNPAEDNKPIALLNLGTINTLTAEEPPSESAEIAMNFNQEDNKGINENEDAPTPEEDPEVSLKPESIIELEIIQTPQPSTNQKENFGMIQNNWENKYLTSEKQFNYPEVNYLDNEKKQFTEETTIMEASSNSYRNSCPKESSRKMNDSKLFLNVFSNFLKNNFPDILNQHVAPLGNKIFDKYNIYSNKSFQNQVNWPNTDPKTTSNIDSILSFDKPTYPYLASKDVNGFRIKNKDKNTFGERNFKNGFPSILPKELDRQTDPSLNELEAMSNISANLYSLNNYPPHQNRFMYPIFYHQGVLSTMINSEDSTEGLNWEEPIQNLKAVYTTEDVTISPLAQYTPQQFISNSSINPMPKNNIWNMKEFDFQSKQHQFISTTLSANTRELYNDNIDYENQHEFNSDHHFTSITEKTLSNNTANNLLKNWIPLDTPFSRNEVNINRSSFQRNDLTEDLTKSIEYFNSLNKQVFPNQKFTTIPYKSDFSIKNLYSGVFNLPIKKLEKATWAFEEPPGSNGKSEIEAFRKEVIGLNKWGMKWETPQENSLPYGSSKESLDLEQYPKIHQMKLPLIERMFFNKNGNDTGPKPPLKNSSKLQLKTSKNNLLDEKVASDKNLIILFTSNVTESGIVNMYKSSVDNMNPVICLQTLDPYTELYDNLNVEKGGGYSLLSTTPLPIMHFESTNIDEPLMNLGNLTSYNSKINWDKFDEGKYQRYTLTKMINDKYIHNYQNEKFLAAETGACNQIFIPSTTTYLNVKNTNPLNSIHFLRQLINQTLPQSVNQSKNEISAVKMSLVKIVNMIPEMLEHNQQTLASDLFVPFQQVFCKDSNNKEVDYKMLAPFLLKIRNVLNKLVAEKKKRKRDEKVIGDNMQTFLQKNNRDAVEQCGIPAKSLTSSVRCHHNKAEISHDSRETSPQGFNIDIKCDKGFSNIRHYKMSDKWRENMQSILNKQNEKKSLNDYYDNAIQEDPSRLLSYDINKKLQHFKPPQKPSEKFVVEEEYLKNRGGLGNKQSKIYLTDINTKKNTPKNILGSKKMKSSELEFILEKNLPVLPLNKSQFISYMMTGRKQAAHNVGFEDEKKAHLSKSNLQNLIDRNAKKQFMSADTSNKRTRKKEWQNKL